MKKLMRDFAPIAVFFSTIWILGTALIEVEQVCNAQNNLALIWLSAVVTAFALAVLMSKNLNVDDDLEK